MLKKAIDIHTGDTIELNGIDFNVYNVLRWMICGRCEVVRVIVLLPGTKDNYTSLLFDPKEDILLKEGLQN